MSGFIYGRNPNAETLDGLDSTAFAILAGQAGGQVLQGGTAANEDLTLEGTAHSTKTSSYVILQPTTGNVGVNTVTPLTPLHVVGAATITGGIRPAADSTAALTLCKANGDTIVRIDTAVGAIYFANFVFYNNGIASGSGAISVNPGNTGNAAAYFGAGGAEPTLTLRPKAAQTAPILQAKNAAGDVVAAFDITGNLLLAAGYQQFAEMTAPGAGAANTARIYAKDNGAGKTQLMVQFATGGEIQIAIEA